MGEPARGSVGGYVHDALLYDSVDDLTRAAAPFLRDGLAAGDAAVIAAGPRTAGVLTEALDDDPRLHVLERSDVYRTRTPAAITAFRRLAERCSADGIGRVRVVGEVDFGPTERDWLEWQRYEAVINVALAAWPLWGLCVFDTRRLPEQVLTSTLRTHPNLVTPERRGSNPLFGDPVRYLRALPVPGEPLQDTRPRMAARDVSDVVGLRHAVAAELATADAPRAVSEDFLLALHEVTSNAVRHGHPPIDVALWTSTDRLVGTVSDGGRGWNDPFAGYGPADGGDLSSGGMGLWLARQLCDHLDITHDGEGVTVRLTTYLR
ncbi:anti-sigma factor RsbA family regulatory protein [Modestobacter sp. URMC 112]